MILVLLFVLWSLSFSTAKVFATWDAGNIDDSIWYVGQQKLRLACDKMHQEPRQPWNVFLRPGSTLFRQLRLSGEAETALRATVDRRARDVAFDNVFVV